MQAELNAPVASASPALLPAATYAKACPWAATPSDLPIYQHHAVMRSLIDALRPHVRPGQMLMWRDAFRWRNDAGVLPNHYECLSLKGLCEDFGYEVVHDFCHVAVVQLPR